MYKKIIILVSIFVSFLLNFSIYAQENWTTLNSGTSKNINDIAYGNGTLVVVGEDGLVCKSTNNGQSWTIINSGITVNLRVVAFGNGAFVAAGTNGLYTSTNNGNTWTNASMASYVDIAFGNGIFVAIGNTSTKGIMKTSTNGVDWTSQSPNPDDNGIHSWEILNDITFANGKFEAVGRGLVIITIGGVTIPHQHEGFIMDSENGMKWGRESYGEWDGTTKKYKYLKYVHELINELNLFVAIGESNSIYTSSRSTWTALTSGTNYYSLTWANDLLVTVGENGSIYTSNNAKDWTKQSSPITDHLRSIFFSNNTFFAVGDNGNILKSTEEVQLPIADFFSNPTSGTAPLTVQFTDQSTGNITSRSWTFGDGQTSTATNPSHTYQNAGTYTVKLTVTGAGGSNTKTRSNYISVSSISAPVANFYGAPTSGTAPLTVQFTDQSTGNITNRSWTFGDGQTSTATNPSHTYQNAGTYTVKLTVTGTGGSNTKIRSNYISVAGETPPAQFRRIAEIPIPEAYLNNGGVGNMVSGVDIDQDGKTEIYLVNNNWNDDPNELIPRIYKLEKSSSNWNIVWRAVAPIPKQNTWPTLSVADLDKDGKKEIVWGVVNYTDAGNPNPARILVYETPGDGSDAMGLKTGNGNYLPNASWSIASEDNVNLRIIDWEIADPDGDGTDEIVFADRKGSEGGHFFGVISVSDIPDFGNGSEIWRLETSGKNFSLQGGIQNKWDVAILGSNSYFFCEGEISKLSWNGSWHYSSLAPLAGGAAVQSSEEVDLNGDGKKEILCVAYDWGDDAHKSVMLLQESGGSLTQTELINISSYWPSGLRGGWGSAIGDLDLDGKPDYVFGSRASTPNAIIFRVEYQGGDITYGANYKLTIIDSEAHESEGIWNVINLANVDNDPELEVLYTSSIPVGDLLSQDIAPIIILDLVKVGVEQVFNRIPIDFMLDQNYPNPFNPTTTISYSIETSDRVTLTIYNFQGKEINTLVNERQSAGVHQVRWDGTNNSGEKVASGLYLYSLRIGTSQVTKRMMLVK